MEKFIKYLIADHWGKPGLGFVGFGTLLDIAHSIKRADALFWGSMVSMSLGIIYYLLKILFEFIIKKNKK